MSIEETCVRHSCKRARIEAAAALTAERTAREAAEATSEGRRIALLMKAEEVRREWLRAEAAEAENARLRGEIGRLADSLNDDGGEGFAKTELRTLLTPITRTDGEG